MPSGISSFNPPSLHKFSSTPYQIGTFEGHPMYEVVLNTVLPTSSGGNISGFTIAGKTIVKVSGINKLESGSIVGWQQIPYQTLNTSFINFWCDTINLRCNFGTDDVNYSAGKPTILLIRYYTS